MSIALTSQELALRREQSQSKTFTAWMNYHLAPVGLRVEILEKDLADGIIIIRLCETLTGEELKPNLHPRIRIHRVENCNKALTFMKTKKVKIFNIAAEDIVDGNLKMLLALVWGMIRTFQIMGASNTNDVFWEWQGKDGTWKLHNPSLSHKLEENWSSQLKNFEDFGWVFDLSKMTQESHENGQSYALRRRTNEETKNAASEDDAIRKMLIEFLCEVTEMDVKNLTDNLVDGLVLSRMVEKIYELVHHKKIDLSKESILERIQTFIDCANERLSIPALIEAKDLEVGAVDQKSMMLYLSLFKSLYDERKNLENLNLFPEVQESISSLYNLSSLWQDKLGNIWSMQLTDNYVSIRGNHQFEDKEGKGKWVKDEHEKWSSLIEWEDQSHNQIWLQDPDTIPSDNGEIYTRYVDAASQMDPSSFWKDQVGNTYILQNSTHGDNKMTLQGDHNIPHKSATGTWVYLNHKWIAASKWGDQSESVFSFIDEATLDIGNGQHLTRYFPEISTYIDLNGKWRDTNGRAWNVENSGNDLKITNEESSSGRGIWMLEDNLWACPISWSDDSEGELKLLDADTLSLNGLILSRNTPSLSSDGLDLSSMWIDSNRNIWSLKNDGNALSIQGTGPEASTLGQGDFRQLKDGTWEAQIVWNDRPEVQMKVIDQNTIVQSDGNRLTRQIGPPPLPPVPAMAFPEQRKAEPLGGQWENGVYVISNGVGYNSTSSNGQDMGGRSYRSTTSKKGSVGFMGKAKDTKSRVVRESKHAYRTNAPIHDTSMHSRFTRAFKFTSPEPLYLEFPCKFASSESCMMIGHAYVTRNFFCFCGANGKDRLSVILPLDEILKIQEGAGGTLNNYSRVPKITPVAEGHKANAILIHDINNRTHRFYSVDNIKKALKLLNTRWMECKKGDSILNTVSPQMQQFGKMAPPREISTTTHEVFVPNQQHYPVDSQNYGNHPGAQQHQPAFGNHPGSQQHQTGPVPQIPIDHNRQTTPPGATSPHHYQQPQQIPHPQSPHPQYDGQYRQTTPPGVTPSLSATATNPHLYPQNLPQQQFYDGHNYNQQAPVHQQQHGGHQNHNVPQVPISHQQGQGGYQAPTSPHRPVQSPHGYGGHPVPPPVPSRPTDNQPIYSGNLPPPPPQGYHNQHQQPASQSDYFNAGSLPAFVQPTQPPVPARPTGNPTAPPPLPSRDQNYQTNNYQNPPPLPQQQGGYPQQQHHNQQPPQQYYGQQQPQQHPYDRPESPHSSFAGGHHNKQDLPQQNQIQQPQQ